MWPHKIAFWAEGSVSRKNTGFSTPPTMQNQIALHVNSELPIFKNDFQQKQL